MLQHLFDTVASFSEAWIEIEMSLSLISRVACRLLLGGVDWNISDVLGVLRDLVASFSEAWIEIYQMS